MAESNVNKVTVNQVRAINALLGNSTIEQASSEIGVNPRTIYRWMKSPVFVAALRKAETQAMGDHVRALVVDLEDNRRVIQEIRDNSRYSPAVRLRAAGMIEDSALKWSQFLDIRTIILEMEGRLNEIEQDKQYKE